MSQQQRERWDARYANGDYKARTEPTDLLTRWAPKWPRGHALDVATGTGRNALYLAQLGFEVTAFDLSKVALEKGRAIAATRELSVNWINIDTDVQCVPGGHFDLIVVARFHDRRIVPQILDRLVPGGWLVYEHHLLTTRTDVGGPPQNAFRLRTQELLQRFRELHVKHYFEGPITDPDGRKMMIAELVAQKAGVQAD